MVHKANDAMRNMEVPIGYVSQYLYVKVQYIHKSMHIAKLTSSGRCMLLTFLLLCLSFNCGDLG